LESNPAHQRSLAATGGVTADLYQILGVPPGATLEQVKAGYRRRALRHHPDKNEGCKDAEERFKQCSEAYATLTDPKRRAEYDAHQWVSRSPSDLVGGFVQELIGGPPRRRRSGRDLHVPIVVSLEQAARGVQRTIALTVDQLCKACLGYGAPSSARDICPDCRGRGEWTKRGLLSLPRVCSGCGGQGRRYSRPCPACSGVGMVEETRNLSIRIAPGVRDGEVQTVRGQGQPGLNGGKDGDLHVIVSVQPHPFFERRGTDLVLDLPVTLATAVCGGSVEIPTLETTVKLKIHPSTQSGMMLRLANRGMPSARSRGDILVRIQVEIPGGLDAAQRQRVVALEQDLGPGAFPLSTKFSRQLNDLRTAREQTRQP